MTKLYDKVKTLLQMYPEFRDSDEKLAWDIWKRKFLVRDGFISEFNFITAKPSMKSIGRARRKVQENHPELKSSERVQKFKDIKESKKGFFPYHEEY